MQFTNMLRQPAGKRVLAGLLIALIALAAVMLGGCGGNSQPSPTPIYLHSQ